MSFIHSIREKILSVRIVRNPVIVSTFLIFCTCSNDDPMTEAETFNNADRPYYSYNSSSDYYWCMPWNYNKDINKNRSYPLVVYLHGWGGAGDISSLNYLGYDTKNGTNEVARKFQTEYPSFVLIPQSTADEWEPSKVIAEIEDFKSKYRIDASRIYLIGYSMGGAGTYIIANGWYDYNQSLFAGIIRLVGQSQTTLRETVAQKSSVWLHVGLKDTQLRIDVTRSAYSFLKSKHPDATESSVKTAINGVEATTVTLKKTNEEIVKKTEYSQLGHEVNLIPFEDPNLIKWLFSQKL
jgi:predicted peptidase